MRFRVAGLRGDRDLRRALEAGLGGNGIRAVSANDRTGTVLVHFDPSQPVGAVERRVRTVAARRPGERSAALFADGPAWHAMDAARALDALGSNPGGLSTGEARARLRRHGPNALAQVAPRSPLETLVAQFRNLPSALLVGTALLSLATGGVADAVIVLLVIALNGMIGFFSERWTEREIASLDNAAALEAIVLRDGSEVLLPAEQLVPGDVIRLHRDASIAADARLIVADGLAANEAMLTGESLPAVKAANALAAPQTPLADRRNMVFRGSMITGGSGLAVVVATGERTEMSRIQTMLQTAERPPTPLQVQLDQLGRLVVLMSAGAAALVFTLGLLRGRGVNVMVRAAVSLGVAALPEGLPTMLTTALAVSARRLASHGMLVRRLAAIEALGGVHVVCFDKTGTLTLNRMTVVRLAWGGRHASLDATDYRDDHGRLLSCDDDRDLSRLIEVCALCNDAEPDEAGSERGSATEAALLQTAARVGFSVADARRASPRVDTIERAQGRRYMATIHATSDGSRLIAVKGDPSAVLPLCNTRLSGGRVTPLSGETRRSIAADNAAMARQGLRVLGIAYREASAASDGAAASDLVWLGLVGMADPIRPGAAELIAALRQAGISMVMLTGDQRATAVAIAAEAGLAEPGSADVADPDEPFSLPPGRGSHRIFARLTPEQKLRVIGDIQASGLRVAMIGDGVNDSPALKAADIGVTLAGSATPVARDVADIVLLDDDLEPLIEAFASGRAVRANVRSAVRFLLATNLSEIMLTLLAAATGSGLALTPAQLLWINLVTDVVPASGIALQAPDPALMTAPVEDEPLLSGGRIGVLARDAGLISAAAVAAQTWASARRGPASGSSVGLAGLIAGQLLYALACGPKPGQAPRGTAIAALAATFAAQMGAMALPGLDRVFGRPPGLGGLAIAAAAGLAPVSLIRLLDASAASRRAPPTLLR